MANIYFDMDGVIAKWNENASIEDVSSKGYFLSVEPEMTVRNLILFLQNLGFDIKILTAVYENGYAAAEKRQWLKNIGLEIPIIFVPYGHRKTDYIPKEGINILVDDFKKNLEEWEQNPFFKAIKFYNGINNRPRMTFDEMGVGHLTQDSWQGLSINHNQSYEEMAMVICGAIMFMERLM